MVPHAMKVTLASVAHESKNVCVSHLAEAGF